MHTGAHGDGHSEERWPVFSTGQAANEANWDHDALENIPMSTMIFLKIGWMEKYAGLNGDTIWSRSKFIREHGYGHEIFNNMPYKGHVYGYVQANDSQTIDISRLGDSNSEASINDVLVIWVSAAREGGVYVVGWYKHATVYRSWQPTPGDPRRKYRTETIGYNVKARTKDCTFLKEDSRFSLRLKVPGTMRRASVWYACKPEHRKFKQGVLKFINTHPSAEGHCFAK